MRRNYKSNWDKATSEQKQIIIDNVIEAVKVLQKSVAERHIREEIVKITANVHKNN